MQDGRHALAGACTLLALQAVALWLSKGQTSALLSDVVQLLLGVLCVLESTRASRRSRGAWRYYWLWLAVTFGIWTVAQVLGVYIDKTENHFLDPVDDLLFFLSGIPFGMLLFLDPDEQREAFDRLHLLDFLQICGFWICVYLYFSRYQVMGRAEAHWGPFGWSTSLVFNGVVALSFVFRALVTNSGEGRKFFGLLVGYLFLSGLADSYFSFAPNKVTPGTWFGLVWSGLLFFPLFMAATWKKAQISDDGGKRRPRTLVNQMFPLVYPFFSLLLIAQMAETKRIMDTLMGCVIFLAVSVRALIIQGRLIRAQDQLEFEATHDALTGLANRRAVLEHLDKELDRHRRTGEPVGLIMADADHFKKINDVYGHAVGDQVLRELARRMKYALRSYDSAGRYGGEEFLIVLPNCDAQNTFTGAERLRESVAQLPVNTSAGMVPVTMSMGFVAAAGAQDSDSMTLLYLVDEALYRAKRKGRNRVEGALMKELSRN
jgi:diguanylate cyclase (GGDEF)-like protein